MKIRCTISFSSFSVILFTFLQGINIGQAIENEIVRLDFVVRSKTELPLGCDIYLAGSDVSLGPWKPNGMKLEHSEETDAWHCHVGIKKGAAFSFKFTCGNWESVEKGSHGEDIANRKIIADARQEIVVVVDAWGDRRHDRRSTATGDLRYLEVTDSKSLAVRGINIWLPAGYANTTQRYQVLYLLDGQNVFDAAKAAFGVEWQADEAAEKLISQGRIEPFIIVAIDNSPRRVSEYTRNKNSQRSDHLTWIVDVLKPRMDVEYRTLPGPESTTIGGSSLGGLLALEAFVSKSEVFGNAICMSPSLFWDDECLLKLIERGDYRSKLKPRRIWVDFGSHESDDELTSATHLSRFTRLKLAFESQRETDGLILSSQVKAGGEHNESAWAERLPDALFFIFKGNP